MFTILKTIRFNTLVLVLAGALFICSYGTSRSDAPSNQARVWSAVNKVRLDLAARLKKTIPSLNVIVQTPSETIFASASNTPNEAITPDT
ncbi:MAG: hypothetical protein JRL30_14365, partial [Deltaproteobacteria bacterium]|nr:hypothetical protein [Deltaproteobacteria bacterium]